MITVIIWYRRAFVPSPSCNSYLLKNEVHALWSTVCAPFLECFKHLNRYSSGQKYFVLWLVTAGKYSSQKAKLLNACGETVTPLFKIMLDNTALYFACVTSQTFDYALHYNDVIMSAMASQITSLAIVYSSVYSGADQRKHQSSASLPFVRQIYRWIPRTKGQ